MRKPTKTRGLWSVAFALSLTLCLTGCGKDDVETDLAQLDQILMPLDQPPAALDNIVAQIRLAQSDADRAALMRNFAAIAKEQLVALEKFDAKTYTIDWARSDMARGLSKARTHALRGAEIYAEKGASAAPETAAELQAMSAGYAEYQTGVRGLEAIAGAQNYQLKFNGGAR